MKHIDIFGLFKTYKYEMFGQHLLMTISSSDNEMVWHIAGKRFDTLDEVRRYHKVPEEYLMTLVLKYGNPHRAT